MYITQNGNGILNKLYGKDLLSVESDILKNKLDQSIHSNWSMSESINESILPPLRAEIHILKCE